MSNDRLLKMVEMEKEMNKYKTLYKQELKKVHAQNAELGLLRKEVEKLRPVGEKLKNIKKILRGALESNTALKGND